MLRQVRVLVICVGLVLGFNPYPKRPSKYPVGVTEDPLILTPLIIANRIDEARALAKVKPLLRDEISYSGFLTVNNLCNSNLFFWFFPATSGLQNSSWTVWLQGGPGSSSLYGLFNEHGPYYLTPQGTIERRKYSWTHLTSILYIDNPVGTGFSFADSVDCYSKNETAVGQNLLKFMKQFILLFPELQSAPLYIAGESYGGKYVPALGHAIHVYNVDREIKFNLQGLSIGNGLVDPVNQLNYGDYLYQIGLIDNSERAKFIEGADQARSFIEAEKWQEAFNVFDNLLNGDQSEYPSFFKNFTGYDFYFNYLFPKQYPEGDESQFVNSDKIRKAIHVGNRVFNSGVDVETALLEDIMKSVAPWLSELLEYYRVLLYNGQLDIIVAYPLTESYLQVLDWSAAQEYRSATRKKWYVKEDLAGYVKSAGNLQAVLVRNAGHMVPQNQPLWAFELFGRFLQGTKLPDGPCDCE